MQEFVGTPERLGALRGLCLTRDRHRCVITRAFDSVRVREQLRIRQNPPRDDDGNVLDPRDGYSHLEVAHILPFSLTKAEGGGELVCGLFLFVASFCCYRVHRLISKRTSLRRLPSLFLICLTLV